MQRAISPGESPPRGSFRTLLDHLGGIVRNSCKRKGADGNEPADVIIETTPGSIQQRAFDLISEIGV